MAPAQKMLQSPTTAGTSSITTLTTKHATAPVSLRAITLVYSLQGLRFGKPDVLQQQLSATSTVSSVQMYMFPTLQPLDTVTHCSTRASLSFFWDAQMMLSLVKPSKEQQTSWAAVGPEESIWPSALGRAKSHKLQLHMAFLKYTSTREASSAIAMLHFAQPSEIKTRCKKTRTLRPQQSRTTLAESKLQKEFAFLTIRTFHEQGYQPTHTDPYILQGAAGAKSERLAKHSTLNPRPKLPTLLSKQHNPKRTQRSLDSTLAPLACISHSKTRGKILPNFIQGVPPKQLAEKAIWMRIPRKRPERAQPPSTRNFQGFLRRTEARRLPPSFFSVRTEVFLHW